MTSQLAQDQEPTTAAQTSGEAPSRPANAIVDLNAARAAAQEIRSEWLTAVTIGVLTIHDLVEHAATPSGKALRRVTLRRLLLASPDFTIKQTDHILQHVNDVLGLAGDDRKKPRTIQWLLDDRTGGRRVITWTDATAARELPWLGWPATPRPRTTFR